MAPVRRIVTLLALALVAVLAAAPQAFAHAVLLSSTPPAGEAVPSSPGTVLLRFSEQVQILNAKDVQLVDDHGNSVAAAPAHRDPADAKVIQIPVRPGLADGTYTVRYLIVSADSHIVGGAMAFGVGPGPVADPYLAGATSGGPSETSPWAVSARFLELVGLGGLLGLLAFRWLVWRPAWRRAEPSMGDEGGAVLAWGRDLYWVVFGILAVGSMLAEGYLLLTKSASALGVGIWAALRDPSGISQVLGDTRFGSLVQLRGGLLFALFALGIWQFLSEFGSERSPRAPSPAGKLIPAVLMAALVLSVLGGISAQGHASQAPWPTVQIAADLTHLTAVSVWIGGLAMTGLVFLRARKVAPEAGPVMAASVLARFSKVAMVAVGVAVATGVIRSIGELSAPEQLWDTSYGRSIIYKILILCPIAFLALRNRRIVTALRVKHVVRPNTPTVALVSRGVQLELLLSLAVVVVASLLVAQVPGRT
jgi:copper transport protein